MKNTWKSSIWPMIFLGLAIIAFNACDLLNGDDADPEPNGTPVDPDGNEYQTVTIGTQIWMAENLKTTRYANGNHIPNLTDNVQWRNTNSGAFAWFHHNIEEYGVLYGALYNWHAVASGTLCPTGWRVPTDDDWKVLEAHVDSQHGPGHQVWDDVGWRGLDVGAKLKSTSGWDVDGNGTDQYEFNALPGGFRDYSGLFHYVRNGGYWWTISEMTVYDYGWYRYLHYADDNSFRDASPKNRGYSVRCMRDL